MKRQVDVILNGASILTASNKIIAVRAPENPIQNEVISETNGVLSGRNIIDQRRADLNISVFVKIRELYDMPARMEVVNRLNTWAAAGGILKISYRPGMQLPVKLIKPAAPGDILDYNTEIELLFAANGLPFWQDATQTVENLSTGSGSIAIPGNAPTTVDFTIICNSSVSDLTLTIAGKTLSFSDIGAQSGDAITITHDDFGRMTAKCESVSILNKLTALSHDCMIAPYGMQQYSFTSSGSITILAYIRGRWL